MSYRVRYKGLDVICENVADIDALAASSSTDSSRVKRIQKREHRSVRRLIRELNENQRKLLEMLLASGEKPVIDTDLRAALRLDNNKALAGILAGISKRAKSAGIDGGSLLTKSQSRNGSGERHYAYRIVPEASEEVRSGLGN